jgi:predicted peptidase
MYSEDLFFAAILRMAGQSQSDLSNEIAEKTAVWYHIGLEDTETRVQVARDALDYMRGYECNAEAIESTEADEIGGYERTTTTLIRNERPMFVYSEYDGMGHTAGPCYEDDELFPWMFSHYLE